MASRMDLYRTKRNDDLGDPNYWDRKFKDIDARISANEEQRDTLEEVIEEGRQVFRAKANEVLLPLIKEVHDMADVGAFLRTTSATEHDLSLGGKVFYIDEGHRLSFAAPAYVTIYRMETPQAAMLGEVVSYTKETGELVVDVTKAEGTGYGGGWTVTVGNPSDTADAIAGVFQARDETKGYKKEAKLAQAGAVTAQERSERARGETEAFAQSIHNDADRAEAAIDELETINGSQSKIYLGAFDVDPLLDLNGDPLVKGAEYYNTIDKVKKIYDGHGWTISYVPVGSEVTSVYGRMGNVTAQVGDYSSEKITRTVGAGGVDGATVEAALADLQSAADADRSAKADKVRKVTGSGLATGGGDFSADRVINVPEASDAEAQQGTDGTKAMTARRTKTAIDALVPEADTTKHGKVRLATPTQGSQGIAGVVVDAALMKASIDAAINALVGGAPGTLDQIHELADAIGDDPNFATTVANQIASKLDASNVTAWALQNLLGAGGASTVRSNLSVMSSTDINSALSDKSNNGHTHDDRYYTKSISDERFLGIDATAANATKLGGHLASYFASAASLSNYYNKTTADGRYLGKTAKAADSDKLGGKNASEYITAIAILEDQKPQGTSPQAGKTAWYTRDINTEVSDPNGIVTLASNQFTVSKDCYAIISVPGRDLSINRLWNVTDAISATGVAATYSGGGYTYPNTFYAPLTAGKTYEVQQRDNAVSGSGVVTNVGVEVYTRVLLIG
nr:hypothetical protein [uncultured Cohaesibacter sp.]